MSVTTTIGPSGSSTCSCCGAEFEGDVTGMGLTYVSIQSGEGLLHVLNAGILAAAVGPAHHEEPLPASGSPAGSPGPVAVTALEPR